MKFSIEQLYDSGHHNKGSSRETIFFSSLKIHYLSGTWTFKILKVESNGDVCICTYNFEHHKMTLVSS